MVKNPPSSVGDLGLIPFVGTNIPRAIVSKKERKKKRVFLAFSSRGEGWGILAMTSALESLSFSRPPTTHPAAAASHLGGAQPTADCSRSFSPGSLLSVCPLLSKVFLILVSSPSHPPLGLLQGDSFFKCRCNLPTAFLFKIL